tara:strand:+ start:1131 stop:1376 length:246 start_codon:yes stop_codon:yes gene_type:complete
MPEKKTYLDSNNLMNESFLSDLGNVIKSGKLKLLRKAAKDKKVKKALDDLNKATNNLEDLYKKRYGSNAPKLHKFSIFDFI